MAYVCICFALTQKQAERIIQETNPVVPLDVLREKDPNAKICAGGRCAATLRPYIESHRQQRIIPIKPAA